MTHTTTIFDQIKEKLEAEPRLRERRFSRNWLAESALEDAGLLTKWISTNPFSLDDLLNFYMKYDTRRHEYSKVQKEHKNLRGEDYEDKKELNQQVQIDRGYESGYHQNVKVLERLSP